MLLEIGTQMCSLVMKILEKLPHRRRQNDLETFKESLVREQRRSQELKQEIKVCSACLCTYTLC